MRIEGEPGKEVTYNSGPEILDLLDQSLGDMNGKNILDIGSGERTLENYLRDSGFSAKVISMDQRLGVLADPKLPNTAVQAIFNKNYAPPFTLQR